ncbi:MAG: nitroreductase family protein [Bacteroidales bacterium]|nr:nitroreductase family protein [Bacteroidales bacterium]
MRNIIMQHRSIRQYKNIPVDEKDLNEILEAGTRASTTGNMQLYSIVVTRDEGKRKELSPVHFDQPMVMQAPVHLTFCADINRFHKWCEQRDAEPAYDNFLWYINAAIDALLVSQNVCLTAEAKGMGICYLGTATYNADQLIKILNLPNGVIPVAAIVMGYPDEDPGLTDRLPLEGVVHYETYKDYTDEDIDRIFAEKESLEETKQILKENNKETLAQVYTDNRYKKEDNLYFSKQYLKVLQSQGFMNHM